MVILICPVYDVSSTFNDYDHFTYFTHYAQKGSKTHLHLCSTKTSLQFMRQFCRGTSEHPVLPRIVLPRPTQRRRRRRTIVHGGQLAALHSINCEVQMQRACVRVLPIYLPTRFSSSARLEQHKVCAPRLKSPKRCGRPVSLLAYSPAQVSCLLPASRRPSDVRRPSVRPARSAA